MAEKNEDFRRSNRVRKSSKRNGNLESAMSNKLAGESLILSASTDKIVDRQAKPTSEAPNVEVTPANKESDVNLTSSSKNENRRAESLKNRRGGVMADARKTGCRYEVDLSEMLTRDTINVVDLKNYLSKSFKNNGTINNLADNVTVNHEDFKVVIHSKIFFKKSAVKYHAKKFLKMKKLRHMVKVVGSENKNSYRLTYYTP